MYLQWSERNQTLTTVLDRGKLVCHSWCLVAQTLVEGGEGIIVTEAGRIFLVN